MECEIHDNYSGVPAGTKYDIEDTPETEREWRALLGSFSEAFPQFTQEECKDYEFADWHHGMRVLPVYLHNEGFYDRAFIEKVQGILLAQRNEAFAGFECYNSSLRLIGRVTVLKHTAIFDRLSEETGLLSKLVEPRK